jgi:uncharacterized protein
MNARKVNRRNFLTSSTTVLAGAAVGIVPPGICPQETPKPKIKSYRTLGRTGCRVSDIGCGPAVMSDEGLLKAVLETGVNIIDTAEFYGNGNNERLVGKGIKGIKRDSLFINTKIQITESHKSEDIVLKVRNCLGRMEIDYLDGMMLWNPGSSKQVKNEEFHKAFDQLKKEGRVKYCGVSCHGSEYGKQPENMDQIIGSAIEDGRFDVVLFVYNYVQQEMGNNILRACAEKNVGAILMKTNPFNGRYTDMISKVRKMMETNSPVPENMKYMYEATLQKQKAGEEFLGKSGLSDPSLRRKAAVGFALDNPAVSSVLISFSTFDEIEPYVSLSGSGLNRQISENIKALRENLNHLYCRHACGICESQCPEKVPVNTIMRYHHYFLGQGREKYAMQKYSELPGAKPGNCIDCVGHCEAACPYGVSIKALLLAAFSDLEMKTVS